MKVLETPRLVLRQLTTDDVDNLMGIFSDPVAMRFYPSPMSKQEVRELIQRHLGHYREYGIGLWAALLKEKNADNTFVGLVGLIPQDVEGKREIEIGYLFLRSYWGLGLATEGAVACRDYGFNKLGLQKLISLIDPDNKASIRVAEKVGMSLEKNITKWDKPILVYAISRSADI